MKYDYLIANSGLFLKSVKITLFLLVFFSLQSCGEEEYYGIELIEEIPKDNGIVLSDSTNNKNDSIQTPDKDSSNGSGERKYLIIEQYTTNSIKHQSAACYGDYAFFVTEGMKQVEMFNMRTNHTIFVFSQESIGQASIYHSNQSCFGAAKYDPNDPFPLLYVSVFQSKNRCSTLVYRILPNWNDSTNEYDSFSIELVQRIYYPTVSDTNALYNVNTVVDIHNNCIYTYSRNNNSNADNYLKCRISKFPLPDAHSGNVTFENNEILDSFELNVFAANMQGAALDGNYLYIGRGYPGAGYVYLYIIDLSEKRIKYTVDLLNNGFYEEPEGVYFYNGILYVSTAIRNVYQFIINTEASNAKAISIPFDFD